jgi:hypothetical protein
MALLSARNIARFVAATSQGGGGAFGPASLSGLVAYYSFAEGGGQFVYNRAGGNGVDTNLFGSPEPNHSTLGQSPWEFNGVTLTDYYAANPVDGQQTAARLVMASGGSKYMLQNVAAPADGNYVLSLWAKSLTGAAQKVRISLDNTGTLSPDKTLPADGSWQHISHTQALTAGNTGRAPIVSGSDNAALDIAIYGCKFEPGTVPTDYLPPKLDLTLGKTGGVDSADPVWSSLGLGTDSGLYFQGFSSVGITLSQCTVYIAARRTGTIDNSGYLPLLMDNYDGTLLRLMVVNGGNPPRFGLNGAGVQAIASDLLAVGGDKGWHVWQGVYDGTTISLYFDDVLLASNTGSITPYTLRHLVFATANGAGYWVGNESEAALYSAAHNAAQRAQMRTQIQGVLSGRGQTYNPTLQDLVVIESDSNGVGTGFREQWPYIALNALTPIRNGKNFSVSGSTITDLNTRAPDVDALYDATRRNNLLVVDIGTNGLLSYATAADWLAALKTYLSARKATGWKILVATLKPNTDPGFNTRRAQALTLMYADASLTNGTVADGLIDFAGDSRIGPDAKASDNTIYSDGKHFTALAETYAGADAATAIAGALV